MSKPEVNRYYADCNKLGICERDECDVQVVLASSYDVLSAQRDELLGLLREVYSDLPSRRDWLDPVLEAQIKDTLEHYKC